jgi:hypothetical protein
VQGAISPASTDYLVRGIDNATEAGRQLNRRVELWILPVVAN